MAHSQDANSPLHLEILRLKVALDASQKQNDRYAHLIATLCEELNEFRKNICYACKVKVVLANVPAPAVVTAPSSSTDSRSPAFSSSASTPVLCPMFQGRKSQPHSPSPIMNPVAMSLSDRLVVPAAVPELTSTATNLGGPGELRTMTSLKQSKFPGWSVVYNPEVTKALDLHLAHVLTYESPVSCVNMSPDGQVAIGFANKGKACINDVKTGLNICTFVDRYIEDQLHILCLQLSPDGQLLATAASDYNIRIWDVRQKRMRAMFKGHEGGVNAIAFSFNGRFLVSGSTDCSVRIWNIRGSSPRKLIDNANSFFSVAFSPESSYIAAGDFNGLLRIWDVRTTRLVAKWNGHTDTVWCTKFSPDGKGLMSGGTDNTLKYWDASSLGIYEAKSKKGVVVSRQTLPEIRRFIGHTGVVRSIAFFSRNSRWVATCSEDESVRIWDMETGVWQLTLKGHTDWIRWVDVNPTGNYLATASRDCHCTLWKYGPVVQDVTRTL